MPILVVSQNKQNIRLVNGSHRHCPGLQEKKIGRIMSHDYVCVVFSTEKALSS